MNKHGIRTSETQKTQMKREGLARDLARFHKIHWPWLIKNELMRRGRAAATKALARLLVRLAERQRTPVTGT